MASRGGASTTLAAHPSACGATCLRQAEPVSPELRRIASRVVWWETPEYVVARGDDFLCRVMALGDWSISLRSSRLT